MILWIQQVLLLCHCWSVAPRFRIYGDTPVKWSGMSETCVNVCRVSTQLVSSEVSANKKLATQKSYEAGQRSTARPGGVGLLHSAVQQSTHAPVRAFPKTLTDHRLHYGVTRGSTIYFTADTVSHYAKPASASTFFLSTISSNWPLDLELKIKMKISLWHRTRRRSWIRYSNAPADVQSFCLMSGIM